MTNEMTPEEMAAEQARLAEEQAKADAARAAFEAEQQRQARAPYEAQMAANDAALGAMAADATQPVPDPTGEGGWREVSSFGQGGEG